MMIVMDFAGGGGGGGGDSALQLTWKRLFEIYNTQKSHDYTSKWVTTEQNNENTPTGTLCKYYY